MASGQWTDDPGRAEGVGREYLEGSVAHCNETDTFPRRCEFVVYTYQRMSRSNVLVLVVMAAVVIVPLLHEMQQARRDLQLLQHRLPSLGGGCGRRVVRLAAWCVTTLRTVLLPATVVLTTAGVLLGTPSGLTSTQIILLSMAVSFITVVDDLLSDAFVGRQTLRQIERVQALIDQQRAGAAVNHGSDLAYSSGLHLYLLVLVLNIEVRESPFAQAPP